MKMHVSEKNSNEQPEMVVSSNAKELGPMGQLAALRAEFDEFKRASAEEKDCLISERDAMAEKVDLLTEQVKEASVLPVKPNDEQSKDSEETDHKAEEEKRDTTDPESIDSSETLAKSIPKFITEFDAEVKTRVEGGTKFIVDSVADQFDEEGYIKVLLPGNGMEKDRAVTMPTTKALVDACDIVKNQVEVGAHQVLTLVADQFDEDGFIKALLPGEADESTLPSLPTLPTTKELVNACDTVKGHVQGCAQEVLVSAADQFDENGFMKCCLAQE